MQVDPYAPPLSSIDRAPLAPTDGAGIVRAGKVLVVPLHAGAGLPDHCVKCGEPAAGYRLVRKETWHPPWVYALLMFNLLFYAIGAMVTRKRMELHVPLCEQHRKRRFHWLLGSGLVMGASVLTCAGGALLSDSDLGVVFMLVSLVLLVGGLIALVSNQRPLRAARIDETEGRFTGAAPAFLDRLPSA